MEGDGCGGIWSSGRADSSVREGGVDHVVRPDLMGFGSDLGAGPDLAKWVAATVFLIKGFFLFFELQREKRKEKK